MDSKAILAALMFIVFGAIILVVFISIYPNHFSRPGFQPTPLEFGSNEGDCVSGSTSKCTDESMCPGTKACLHGKWSPCYATIECSPGDTRYCSTGSCKNGVETCNSCSQWGPCIP